MGEIELANHDHGRKLIKVTAYDQLHATEDARSASPLARRSAQSANR